MALLHHTLPRAADAIPAPADWQAQACAWLDDPQAIFLVVCCQTEVLGAACATWNHGEKRADLVLWALDLHLRQGLSGVGRLLLEALSAHLRAQQVAWLQMTVPLGLAVEDAFWRSMGARRESGRWQLKVGED